MVHVSNFTYGPLTPVLGFVMSSLGCFLGLRAATRARASQGAPRLRWLLLATVSIATTGIWVMHFVAMLGFTIPGQNITYSVPITILSMLIAVVVVGIGLLIVGFGSSGWRTLLLGGLIIGFGVASMHYVGMAAMRMPDTRGATTSLVVTVGGDRGGGRTAALVGRAPAGHGWLDPHRVADHGRGGERDALHRHRGHARLRHPGPRHAGRACPGESSAAAFLLPLIIGISLLAFVLTVIISLSPTEAEMREDAALMAHLSGGPGQYADRAEPDDSEAGRWFRPR